MTFGLLDRLRMESGGPIGWKALSRGFDFEGRRVPLVGPQGIFKPWVLREVPLSILTVPIEEGQPRPYEDEIGDDGSILYRLRGTDPEHHNNVWLRRAMLRRVPLVYFHGIREGLYSAAYPAFVTDEVPDQLAFRVEIDDVRFAMEHQPAGVAEAQEDGRRRYVTTVACRRIHQEGFRARVLSAYSGSCAVCLLRHSELLDAAHILSDRHEKGLPLVSNGLSLCKIHHAAFDLNILGIRPDLVVEIREDILLEKDGPMLKHGLQDRHGKRLMKVPSRADKRPNTEHLEERYEQFRMA